MEAREKMRNEEGEAQSRIVRLLRFFRVSEQRASAFAERQRKETGNEESGSFMRLLRFFAAAPAPSRYNLARPFGNRPNW